MNNILKPFVNENGCLVVGSFIDADSNVPIKTLDKSFSSIDEVYLYLKSLQSNLDYIHNSKRGYEVNLLSFIKDIVIMPVTLNKIKKGYFLDRKTLKSTYHSKNEDSLNVTDNKYANYKLLIIADGVGGIFGGEIASNYTVLEISNYFENYIFNGDLNQIVNDFKNKIIQVSEDLINMYGDNNPCTTLTMAIVLHDKTIVFNVGDSRCYAITDKDKIKLITSDHSVVWDKYIKTNLISIDDLRFAPNNNVILSYVGSSNAIMIDSFIIDNEMFSSLILCSDGVGDVLSQEELRAIVVDKDFSIADAILDKVRNKKAFLPDEVFNVVSFFGSAKSNIKDDDASVIVLKKTKY